METALLPPGGPILLGLLGLFLLARRRRAGIALMSAALVLAYLFSIPLTANVLNGVLQSYEPLAPENLHRMDPGAIVVLAGGLYTDAPEYGEDTVNLRTLGRLRYAARLARQTGLPILVTGGYRKEEGHPSEGMAMQRLLEEEFGISDVLVEQESGNTWENAINSSSLLTALEIDTIVLVTHAAHMPRAVEAFQRTGLRVIPAPTLYFGSEPTPEDFFAWLPSAPASYEVRYALHEWLGGIWYSLRYASRLD